LDGGFLKCIDGTDGLVRRVSAAVIVGSSLGQGIVVKRAYAGLELTGGYDVI